MTANRPSTFLRLRGWLHFARQKFSQRFGNARKLNQERDQFYQEIWQRAAVACDARAIDLGDGLLEISDSQDITRLWNNYTPLDDAVTLRLAGNKPAVLTRLQQIGAPTPAWTTFSCHDLAPANALLAGGTCVVKPARNTGAGSGVTTGVQSTAQLARAAAIAAAHDQLLLIEEQIAGENYRLLFLDGQLLETVRRGPPSVLGDGRSTLRQLIAQENQLRIRQGWRRAQALLTIDADMRQTLAQAGLSLGSRPQAGECVPVKTVINENRAAENQLVSTLSPEIVAQCRAAAKCVGARLAGVDLVTRDLEQPLAVTGGVILEVNTTPGLYHHYDPERDECRVSFPILTASLAESHRREQLQQHEIEQLN